DRALIVRVPPWRCTMKRSLFAILILAVGPVFAQELQCPENYPSMPCFVAQPGRLMIIDRSATETYSGGDDQFFNDFRAAAAHLNDTNGLIHSLLAYMHDLNFSPTHDNIVLAYQWSGIWRLLDDAHNGVPITQGTDYGPITPYLTFVDVVGGVSGTKTYRV